MRGELGETKTAASAKPLPLDAAVAAALQDWKLSTTTAVRAIFCFRRVEKWRHSSLAGHGAEKGCSTHRDEGRGFGEECGWPVFSPDGKQIAFFWNGPDQNKVDIYVQPIGGEEPVRLTFSGARRICCLAWSPDGQRNSFVRCENDVGAVYTVPVLGGAERKLTDVYSS